MRGLAYTGSLLLAACSAQPGPALFVFSCTQLDFLLLLHGFTWLGLPSFALDFVNSGSLLLVRSEASFGPGVMTKLELSSCLSVRAMTSLGFPLLVFSSARFGLLLLAPDMTVSGLLLPSHGMACLDFSLFATSYTHLDLSVSLRGVSKVGSVLLALGVVTLGLPLPLRGASHADAILLVASATVSDFSLFLRGVAWTELALFALSTASLESSLSLHSVSRLELPLPVSGLVQMGPLLLLQGLSCVGPALLVLDMAKAGLPLPVHCLTKTGDSVSAVGLAWLGLFAPVIDSIQLEFLPSPHGCS